MKRKDVFYQTKRKVTYLSTAIVFLCLIVFAIITKVLYTSKVLHTLDKLLLEQKRVIETVVAPKEIYNIPNYNDRPMHKLQPIPPNYIVITYEGDRLASISPNGYFDKENLPKFSLKNNSEVMEFKYNDYNFRGTIIEAKDIKVQIIINVDSELSSINQLMYTIIVSLILLSAVALALSYFLSSKIIKPVKEAYDKQVFFVQDASHEMKTPLAVIKGKLELLASSYEDTIEEHFEHISRIMSEVTGLEKLNADLLLLSKEDIDSRINITEFNISKLSEDISEFYMDLAMIQEKNFIVNNLKEDIRVKWDYNKVKRLITILLENAFKYTKDKGSIALSFNHTGKYINIKVEDNGIGISEEEQKRIFDRFFRSADIEVKNISGSGIGLSLLKSISNTLGVKVKLASKKGEGSVFSLSIPIIMK